MISFLQKAQLLGFPTHAAFVLDMRMAKKPEAVATFLSDLAVKLQPLREEEFKLYMQYKKEEVSGVCVWRGRWVGGNLSTKLQLLLFYTPTPMVGGRGAGGYNNGISVSVGPSVHLSMCLILSGSISRTTQLFLTKLGMVVYYHEMECHAGKLVC